jgi:membrane-associated PAP2 superfamily phosphatase
MNRNGALVALAIGAAVGLLFGFYPQLDLKISALFFDPAREKLWAGITYPFWLMRTSASWLIALVAAPAFVSLAVKLVFPQRPALLPGRAGMLMIVTLALGPGLVVNDIFKDHWGRPRPIDVTVFSGTDPFLPWWDPRGNCPKNCSFVAGEPSGAFWTLAPAALVPPPWRMLATGAALVFGMAVGLLRIAAGGHFFSDVAFSGVFTFFVIWLVHGLIYRWRPTRFTDAAVEHWLEKLAIPLQRVGTWIAGRVTRPDPT